MNAIVFSTFGTPDVLQLTDVPELVAGDAQVRINVRVAGVNPIDWKIRSGAMEAVFHTALPAVAGADCSGVVDQVGAGVSDVAVGDAVVGWSDGGSYAQQALLSRFTRKPDNVTFVEAAALPGSGEAALRGLDLLDVRSGQTLVVNGASGSAGMFATQIARERGAIVFGAATEGNLDYVRTLGATPVLAGEGLEARLRALLPNGADAAFDAAGFGALPALVAITGSGDRVVTIADASAAKYGVRFTSGSKPADARRRLKELTELLSAGKIRVEIARQFPLAEAAQAQELSQNGRLRGKIVLVV